MTGLFHMHAACKASCCVLIDLQRRRSLPGWQLHVQQTTAYWQLPTNFCSVLRSPCRRPFAQSAQAVKWAVEVAARQLVQQRLRTHYGGAVQTLAAIEKGLQSRLAKCNQALEHQQATPGASLPLVTFMQALYLTGCKSSSEQSLVICPHDQHNRKIYKLLVSFKKCFLWWQGSLVGRHCWTLRWRLKGKFRAPALARWHCPQLQSIQNPSHSLQRLATRW